MKNARTQARSERAQRTRPSGPRTPINASPLNACGPRGLSARGGGELFMRIEDQRRLTAGRRRGMAVGGAAVLLFGTIWPVYAAGPIVPGAGGTPLPIVQGAVF